VKKIELANQFTNNMDLSNVQSVHFKKLKNENIVLKCTNGPIHVDLSKKGTSYSLSKFQTSEFNKKMLRSEVLRLRTPVYSTLC